MEEFYFIISHSLNVILTIIDFNPRFLFVIFNPESVPLNLGCFHSQMLVNNVSVSPEYASLCVRELWEL